MDSHKQETMSTYTYSPPQRLSCRLPSGSTPLTPKLPVPFGDNAPEDAGPNQRSCNSRSSYKWRGSYCYPAGREHVCQ